MALSPPFIAPCHDEIGAMPREGPAVMKCPDHGNLMLLDIAEQHGQVDAKGMQIMQMDHIGAEFFAFPYQPRGTDGRKTPVESRQLS